MSPSINPGIHVVRDGVSGPRTAVVLGLPRGGTSMVAGTLSHLGIYMGDVGLRHTYEDQTLSKAIEDNRVDDVRRLIAQRNKRYEIWGWKRPSAFRYLDLIVREFREPHFILVFRDLLALAKRREIAIRRDVMATMQSSLGALQRLLDFASSNNDPLLMLSYEKVLLRPRLAVESMAGFLGVDVTEDAVTFITPEPSGYTHG